MCVCVHVHVSIFVGRRFFRILRVMTVDVFSDVRRGPGGRGVRLAIKGRLGSMGAVVLSAIHSG